MTPDKSTIDLPTICRLIEEWRAEYRADQDADREEYRAAFRLLQTQILTNRAMIAQGNAMLKEVLLKDVPPPAIRRQTPPLRHHDPSKPSMEDILAEIRRTINEGEESPN